VYDYQVRLADKKLENIEKGGVVVFSRNLSGPTRSNNRTYRRWNLATYVPLYALVIGVLGIVLLALCGVI
jgi:hypothetical protein